MRVTFEPGIDPELYDTGGSRAACLLYKPDLRQCRTCAGPDFCRLPKDTDGQRSPEGFE